MSRKTFKGFLVIVALNFFACPSRSPCVVQLQSLEAGCMTLQNQRHRRYFHLHPVSSFSYQRYGAPPWKNFTGFVLSPPCLFVCSANSTRWQLYHHFMTSKSNINNAAENHYSSEATLNQCGSIYRWQLCTCRTWVARGELQEPV